MSSLASLASVLQLDAPLRIGFLGRVSNEEKQDPSLSIPRQYRGAVAFTNKHGWLFTKSCWDIESGRKELNRRGHGADGALFGIDVPRDGGLPELLDFARNGEIDAIVVESIDRLSRSTADSTAIEQELLRHDIPIFACDEPVDLNATSLLTRRVKQGIAEFYVADLLQKSRKGMEESVHQGWHSGGPIAYGYVGERHPHPNPHKAADGETKTRLLPCPARGPIVHQIFTWYCVDGLGLGEITDRLNSDLDRYPPPNRNKKDENNLIPCWAKATVQAILRNPKYTGFNVWNRHDKREGRPTLRPKHQWVWSDKPTHDPLVSRELFNAVEGRARTNENASAAGGTQRNAPFKRERSGRVYVMRGRCVCDLCNHRMQGSSQKGENYMRCLWASGRGKEAEKATGHPGSLQVKEQMFVNHTIDFLATRVFSPDAVMRLREEIERAEEPRPENREAKITLLRSDINELEQAIDRQVLTFEKYDNPMHPVIRAAERRIEELHNRKVTLEEALAAVEAQKPAKPAPELADILETLPDLRPALESYNEEELAELFNAFGLEARYNHHEKTLKLSVTVFPALAEILESERPLEAAGRSKSFIAGAGFEPATSGL
jgi:site-specific DNA recombinase